ncbi:MAG: hypothetical protein QM755_12525 [Luteolibacter sp.]
MKAGLRDTVLHHNALEFIRTSEDYSRMQHCVVTLRSAAAPFIACAGSFFPEILPDGTVLQDFMDLSSQQETMHFNILPHRQGNLCSNSFLDVESRATRQLIEAILESSKGGRPYLLVGIRIFGEHFSAAFMVAGTWGSHEKGDSKCI